MYDIITIGSATIDVFIKTSNEVRKHKNHGDICYHLGQKLLVNDLIFTTGGGGTNTAVAFSRLGLKTGFLGILGPDSNGEKILEELYCEHVDFLGKIKKGKTGFSIILPSREDRTILSFKGVNNNLEWNDIHPNLLKTKGLYISTMLGKSLDTIKSLTSWAKQHNIKVTFNISEYLAKQGLKGLSLILKNTNILIMNKQESSLLSGKNEINEIFKRIHNYCKGIIVITDGPKPVIAYDGNKIYKKNIKKISPIDKTGAGDAFAAGFVYGIIKGKDIETSLDYGYKESASVLKHIGAKNNLLREL